MCTQQVVGVCVSGVPVGMNQCLLALGDQNQFCPKNFRVTLVLHLRMEITLSPVRDVSVCARELYGSDYLHRSAH